MGDGTDNYLDMTSSSRVPSLPTLLFASLVGVYGLVMLGATVSVTEALATCGGWPTCDGRWMVLPGEPGATAMAHRILGFVVGLLVAGSVALSWLHDVPRRVRLALALALLLYPVQGGIGALVAIGTDLGMVSSLHLLIGMAIFGTLVVAMAWLLEDRYPNPLERGTPTAVDEATQEASVNNDKSGYRALALAYFRLTKPRLMWLLCLVAAAAMALAAGPALRVSTIVATLTGGVLAIGASGTFNHVLERDIDRRMARTADRPVATDLVPMTHAVAFGVLLAMLSIIVFLVFVNVVAAALGLAAIVFYSVIYTLILKPNTVQNTVIGGAAGSLPALIGWAAVTGSIDLAGVVLALVIFCWTPAHFYNLAMAYRDDYAAGGFPMLPVVAGDRVARKHIMLWAGLTMVMVVSLAALTSLSWLYATVAIVGGVGFIWMIGRLHAVGTEAAAMRTFHASNAYLGAVLVVIAVDALVI